MQPMLWSTAPAAWKEVEEAIKNRRNFHHCVWAIDGKHIAIRNEKTEQTWTLYNGTMRTTSLFMWT